ncbi:MAG: class I SAM-dependent RNA methyltransferase [Actinomycetales bacterium]
MGGAVVPAARRPALNAVRVGARLELEVGAVAHGGHCVARHEGRVVFVRHALPGERVVAVVTEGDGDARYLRADAVEVLEPSPDRVPEPCPFAKPGRCGGCDWQHVALPAQRRLKSAVVEEQLRRLADVATSVPVLAVGDDEDGLRWRTRVQWSVARNGHLGLHRHRSSDVLPIDDCRIARLDVLSIGAQDGNWAGAGAVETVATSTGQRAVVVSPVRRSRTRTPKPARRGPDRLTELPLLPPDVRVVRRDLPARERGDDSVLEEHAGGRRWRVAADGFWQVHPGAAEALRDAVLQSARLQPGESALDLYCGVGLFTAALAEAVGVTGQVWGIEGDRRAAGLAAENLADLAQATVIHADVAAAALPEAADVVVLDPPRSGAGADVCRRVAALRPRAVVYVACDPAALARDVATLAGLGYVLEAAVGFDVFPMTHHVEVVATLVPALES